MMLIFILRIYYIVLNDKYLKKIAYNQNDRI